MKLFSTTEVITNKENQLHRDIVRIDSIKKELTSKRLLLQKLETEFEETLKRQRENWLKEENKYIESKNAIEKETEELEKRKKQALIPLEEREKVISEHENEIKNILAELERKNEDFVNNIEALEKRLEEVSEREQEAERISKIQLKKKEGIEIQQELISNQSKDFNDMMTKAIADISKKSSVLSKKETELLLKETALKDKELELGKIEKGFADREKAIIDKYNTLQRSLNYNKNI